MFSTYKQVILRTYRDKVHSGGLSLRLQSPTPAGIKEELIYFLQKGYDSKKDQPTLDLFFGHQESLAAYVKAVQRTEIDKFKPVISFLKGMTDNPDDKQVHLAALLINYENRPYEFGKDYSKEREEEELMDIEDPEQTPRIPQNSNNRTISLASDPPNPPEESTNMINRKAHFRRFMQSGKRRDLILVPFLVLLIGSGGMIAHKLTGDNINSKQCMYWNEDHYEAVACATNLGMEAEKIALDTFLLEKFKKITLVDTITERSIGKIWYLKHQKQFDYFTAPGKHPLHKKKLSPLSAYIFQREIKSSHK